MGKASSTTTKKALRQSKKRQAINKANRTRLKSQLKKARGAGHSEQKKMMPGTYSLIDKMAKKGIIHKNAAARYKSRLARPKAAEE
jgi:small subunit ribosomal protein S20